MFWKYDFATAGTWGNCRDRVFEELRPQKQVSYHGRDLVSSQLIFSRLDRGFFIGEFCYTFLYLTSSYGLFMIAWKSRPTSKDLGLTTARDLPSPLDSTNVYLLECLCRKICWNKENQRSQGLTFKLLFKSFSSHCLSRPCQDQVFLLSSPRWDRESRKMVLK